MSTRSYCIVLPVCQSDNLQMSAPGLGGCRPEECPSNTQAAWEQRAASWPCLPLGFRSPGHIRDTLTESLSCVHAHTHTYTQGHANTQTNTQAHMFVHYFYTFVRVHTWLHQGHMISHMCILAWLNSLYMHILNSHTHTHIQAEEKSPNSNKHLASWRPTESMFQFFPFFPL